MKNTNGTKKFIAEILEKHTLQIGMSLIGLLITLFNLYVATKLSPIVQNISAVERRVDAIESSRQETKPLIERFYKLEEKVDGISKKADTIQGKIDTVINQHIQLGDEIKGR